MLACVGRRVWYVRYTVEPGSRAPTEFVSNLKRGLGGT